MKRPFLAATAVLTVAAAAACSSSTKSVTGTETMSGKVTGVKVVSGNSGPSIPLKITGPVATTTGFNTPGGNSTKSVVTFSTPSDGNLVVNADAPDANQNPAMNANTCAISQTIHATYTVDGAKSTGKFKDATGSGNATFSLQAKLPKLASGECNTANNAQPIAAGAVASFTATGPLTIKN
jgi:hypothetical protein